MSIAFIFPGQGSQAVGMGAELAKAYPSAREVFEEVDAALSQKLSRVMWEGPEAELTLTENAQPALMAVSSCRLARAQARRVSIFRVRRPLSRGIRLANIRRLPPLAP